MLTLVDHLILSEVFARQYTRANNPATAATRLWNKRRSVVIVTCGAKGCFYLDRGTRTPRHVPAFKVEARDTTGCGDVFHGAYAAALARGMELQGRLRFASAAAALKATRQGGQAGIPTGKAVKQFLSAWPGNRFGVPALAGKREPSALKSGRKMVKLVRRRAPVHPQTRDRP